MCDTKKILYTQLDTLFSLDLQEKSILSIHLETALKRTCFNLSQRKGKYYSGEIRNNINPFNSCDYMIFLYYLSHELFLRGEESLASRVYYLNKSLNCVELFYAVELPNIWNAEHPLGAVMGRAKYGDYFFFYQGCTVGGDGWPIVQYPTIGHNVTMLSNSKILGNSHIGNDCVIAANAYIKNTNIPDSSVVFGSWPNLHIAHKHEMKQYNYAEWI